ncbi:MAG: YdcF family protein [Planctomycetaceae bacterium]|nr:YdcF family protein [Planctomycetaceae bacterium]
MIRQPSILRFGLQVTLVTAAALGICGSLFGRSAVEKLLTALVMPYGIVWYVFTCAAVLVYGLKDRRLSVVMTIAWILLTAVGNGFVADWMALSLERPFLSVQPLNEEPFDYVIVLGGGAATGANLRHQGNGSGDRLLLAAQLYHGGHARRFICTGMRINAIAVGDYDPAGQSASILTALGVPAEMIEKVGGRTTSEEMQTLGRRFSDSAERVGLVTSAWHLKRAMRLADRQGFQPKPLPADFISGPQLPLKPAQIGLKMIPSAGAAEVITRCTKEYLGMLVGR